MVKPNLSRNLSPKIMLYQQSWSNNYAVCESMEMLSLNSGKDIFSICTALFDVVFLPRVWNLSGGRVEVYWNPFGNAEQWIMVLIKPESNKTLSILLDVRLSMTLQVATVHDNNFGCSLANTCRIGAEAWLDSVGGNKMVSRWWHSFILWPYQWWSQGLGKNCFKGSWAGALSQILLGSQVSLRNPLSWDSKAPTERSKSTSHGSQ